MDVAKLTFLTTLECRTKGWRQHRAQREEPTPGLKWRFHEGALVQHRAREWLGNGRLLPSGITQAALDQTAAAVADSASTLLFEATFAAEGCVARADALRRDGRGWELIEIKSGTYKPDKKPDQDWIDDVGYTTAVLQAAHLPITKVSLVLLNSQYVEGEAAPLLVSVDVTNEAFDRATVLREHLQDIADVVTGDEPDGYLQFACRKCDHYAHNCVGVGIHDPLFDIPRLSEPRFKEFAPFGRISALPLDAKLTEIQSNIVQVIRSGREAIDRNALAVLDRLQPPIYYLDFEAVSPAVPHFAGTRPYQKHPFQFSLHVHTPSGNEEHHEYLADPSHDWRRDLTTRLIALLDTSGPIVVYSNYEDQVMKQLGEWFPDLEPQLAAARARLFDLEKVVKDGYIHPGFRGRTSIKKVLPVMSPELSYEGMTVAGGEDAAAVFGFMWVGEYPVEEHAAHREALLRYCKRDTEAMVAVHRGLMAIRNT